MGGKQGSEYEDVVQPRSSIGVSQLTLAKGKEGGAVRPQNADLRNGTLSLFMPLLAEEN